MRHYTTSSAVAESNKGIILRRNLNVVAGYGNTDKEFGSSHYLRLGDSRFTHDSQS